MRLERGLVHVYTGDGKGKTTASVGLAVRSLGRGLSVCFVQFIKGGEPSAELSVLRDLGVEVVRPAMAPTGLLGAGITEEDRRAATEAWEISRRAIKSGGWDVVVLDEVNVALRHELVDTEELLQAIRTRPENVEIVCTGRSAPPALIDLADYVTEMCVRKHPYEEGIMARIGIEF